MTYEPYTTAGKRMKGYMPLWVQALDTFVRVLDTSGGEVADLRDSIIQQVLELFVRSATDWGLSKIEEELALPRNPTLDIPARRDRIVGRLRSWLPATPKNTHAVANAYENGAVDIVEVQDQYRVVVQFVSQVGIPSNVDDLKDELMRFLPANLALEFAYRYNLYQQMTDTGKTYAQLTATGLTYEQLTTVDLTTI